MSKAQYRTEHRQARIDARRANKRQFRNPAWRMWAQGMALLKSILAEESERLAAMAEANWRLDRITPRHFTEE